jgi:hypothetical protein
MPQISNQQCMSHNQEGSVFLPQAKRAQQLQREVAASRKRLSKLRSTHGGLLAEAQQTQEDLQDVQEELMQVSHAVGCTHVNVTLDMQRMQHAQFPAGQHSPFGCLNSADTIP